MSNTIQKGEYIVPLTDRSETNNWNGWVLQQRITDNYVRPKYCPNTGQSTSGWSDSHEFSEGVDWRYATPQEIEAYDKNDGPVKVDNTIITYEIY